MKTKNPTAHRKTRRQVRAVVRQPRGQEADVWSWVEIQRAERFQKAENEMLLANKTAEQLIEIIKGIRREVWLSEVREYAKRSAAVKQQIFSDALRANERAHEYGRFKYEVDGLIRRDGKLV